MNLSNFPRMDPHLLLGLVNTELRNHSESLDDLVKTHDISKEELIVTLLASGYRYEEKLKAFR